MANALQPVRRARPLVPTPTPLPNPGGPGALPAKPVPHAPGAPRRAELPAAGPARPLAGAGPGRAAAGPPALHCHHGTAKGKQRRGWCRTRLHELRSGGLDGGLQAPCPRYHGAQAVQASRPHGAGVRGSDRHHGSGGGVLPWVRWRRGRRNCCPMSPAATRSPASRPQRSRRRHPPRRSSYTSSRRC